MPRPRTVQHLHLTRRRLDILAVLIKAGRPLAFADIAERAAAPEDTVRRSIGRLREWGWVVRVKDHRHPRQHFYLITDAGRREAAYILGMRV